MLKGYIWTLGFFMDSESKEFSFCLNQCGTWRLHWLNLVDLRQTKRAFFILRTKTTTATWTTLVKQEWFILPKVYSTSRWIKHHQVNLGVGQSLSDLRGVGERFIHFLLFFLLLASSWVMSAFKLTSDNCSAGVGYTLQWPGPRCCAPSVALPRHA